MTQLWCAIAPKWVLFRIVLYYVPIWYGSRTTPHISANASVNIAPRSSILATIALYLLVGIEIAKRRRILRSISSEANATMIDETIPPACTHNHHHHNHHDSSCGNSTTAEYDSSVSKQHSATTEESSSSSPAGDDTPKYPRQYAASTATRIIPANPSSLSFRQYILMPLFFFLALLLVWVAPSTNRVASFVDPRFTSYPLMLTVGVTGSLRGFWNGIVFVVVGMRSWKRRKESDEMALRPVTGGRD